MDILLKEFSEDRKYDYNLLTELGLYSENGRILIPYSKDYIVSRAVKKDDKIKSIKPKGKQAEPWFIPGSSDICFIVEGETSALAVKHFEQDFNVFSLGGVNNVHLIDNELKNKFNGRKIILCYDNDEAGKECEKETIKLMENKTKFKDFDVRVLELPNIQGINDIDDYYRNYGTNEKLIKLRQLTKKGERKESEGEFIEELQKRTEERVIIGKKIKCINPEHEDTHPSMVIYSDHAHCYSCGYHFYTNKKEEKFVLPIDNYYDNAKKFHNVQPFFYDKVGLFWFWNKDDHKYEMFDDVDVMRMFDSVLGFQGQCVNAKIKSQTLEAMKWFGRENIPKDAPIKWIQFKDKAHSINSHNTYKVEPNYFFTNPIPWEIGDTEDTPVMDKLFKEWVGEKNVKGLYEMIAYCTYRDYPIQTLFCLYGSGRNGKSCFQKVLTKFLGKENLCSTDLDLLVGINKNRFESVKMYKKLVCLMGETNFGVLSSSSLIKKLTGGDMIGFEKKGKDPFDDYNYAKLIIASNSLPSSDDTSEGFYRRWIIIDFPNEFPEGRDIVQDIPDQEYSNLAKKITLILPDLIKSGKFCNQGTIEQRKQKYIQVSNPLPIFINKYCEKGLAYYVSYRELYTAYVRYLQSKKQRKVTMKEFKSSLENEGYYYERTSKKIYFDNGDYEFKAGSWVDGLQLCADYADYTQIPTRNPYIEERVGIDAQNAQNAQKTEAPEEWVDKT